MSLELKDVFVITEREGDDKNHWTRIGVAFVNKDSSLNVVLDAIPLTGRLHIRDRKVTEVPQQPKPSSRPSHGSSFRERPRGNYER